MLRRHCGSCSHNINGVNTLACIKPIKDLKGDIRIYPLPHMDVVKDLVVDLTDFYEGYSSVEPWLKSDTPAPEGSERLQSKEDQKKLTNPLLASFVHAVQPVAPAIGGMEISILDLQHCWLHIVGFRIAAMMRKKIV